VDLINLGEPEKPRWICHGCCKRIIDRLEKVLKLTPDEILAGGFCRGLAHRTIPLDFDELDRKILETAGKCIQRILNQQEAKP